MHDFRRIMAVYFPIALLICLLCNVPEATLFLPLITYLIIINFDDHTRSKYVGCATFVGVVFVLSLKYEMWRTILVGCVLSIPVTVASYLKELDDLKSGLIPIVELIVMRLRYYILTLPLLLVHYLLTKEYRYFIGCAIVLLASSAYYLALGSKNYANVVAIYSYYMLCFGVLGAFIDYLREQKSDHESQDVSVER